MMPSLSQSSRGLDESFTHPMKTSHKSQVTKFRVAITLILMLAYVDNGRLLRQLSNAAMSNPFATAFTTLPGPQRFSHRQRLYLSSSPCLTKTAIIVTCVTVEMFDTGGCQELKEKNRKEPLY